MKWILATLLAISPAVLSSEKPPELWSWFKDLDKSKEACEIQSSYVLQDLNIEDLHENKYGIYGNVKSNRVVVKCISIADNKSKLMVAVAGNNKDSVEILRNKIVNSID